MIQKITERIFTQIVTEQSYDVYFQPIVEVGKQKLLGCESLFRAFRGSEREQVSTEAFFRYADRHSLTQQLDALSRQKALENYAGHSAESLLFLNLESVLVPFYMEHRNQLLEELSRAGVPPEQIVLELNEKKEIADTTLREFAEFFQAQGFLIAIDDMGERNSNLNRLSIVQPDIVKIDRYMVSCIHKDTYKQIIVRSIADMCRQLGVVVIAEGVECEEEIHICMSMGIRFYQGYYFSRAVPLSQISRTAYWEKAKGIARNYSDVLQQSILHQYSFRKQNITQKLQHELQEMENERKLELLKSSIRSIEDIECVYLLDEYGRQITETLFNEQITFKNNYLYSPGCEGEYHSVQSYYYNAVIGEGAVTKSNAYISTATGHRCVTYSCLYRNKDGRQEILCIDFLLDK